MLNLLIHERVVLSVIRGCGKSVQELFMRILSTHREVTIDLAMLYTKVIMAWHHVRQFDVRLHRIDVINADLVDLIGVVK